MAATTQADCASSTILMLTGLFLTGQDASGRLVCLVQHQMARDTEVQEADSTVPEAWHRGIQ